MGIRKNRKSNKTLSKLKPATRRKKNIIIVLAIVWSVRLSSAARNRCSSESSNQQCAKIEPCSSSWVECGLVAHSQMWPSRCGLASICGPFVRLLVACSLVAR